MATKKLQILDSLIDAYTKTETDTALATKADLITSENLFDVNVFNVANSSLTMTPVENGGVRVIGTSPSDFYAVYRGSLIDMIPGEYQISGGNYNNIYFLVKITRANNSVESKYNTTAVFKDDDISRSCAIVLRKSSTSYECSAIAMKYLTRKIKSKEDLLGKGAKAKKFEQIDFDERWCLNVYI